MKITLLLLLLSITIGTLTGQTVEQIKADNQNYIWGEGTGASLNRADQEALGMLIGQISTQIQSSFTVLKEEIVSSGKSNFTETVKGVVNTYSSATLRNTERIVINNEPEAKIFRYLKRSAVDSIFTERERKIIEFAKNGEHFESTGEIAYALRYYYWALTLLRSHPNGGKIVLTDGLGQSKLLISYLPLKINTIFSGTKISIINSIKDGNLTRYNLNIQYNKKPAQNFDYVYWTGKDWTNIYSSRDGIGYAEVAGDEAVKEIKFKAEYAFEGETNIDNELRDVMGKLEIIPFRGSYFNVQVAPTQAKQTLPETRKISTLEDLILSEVANTQPYDSLMAIIVKAIKAKNYEKVRPLFMPDAFEKYVRLLQYGDAKIIGDPKFKYVAFESEVMCRSVPMGFHFKNNTRDFTENVIFQFNKERKVSNLTFGLNQIALTQIVENTEWKIPVKLVLLDFLENYKTAYALKCLDYIESIFADDALIIVGKVLEIAKTGENQYLNNKIIKYNRLTKEDFVKRLRHSFLSNEFINIRFEDCNIVKSGKGDEIYGIQIKQDYFSSTYGDKGYLFLMVDLKDYEKPVIHVRTWQPDKDPNGKIYGLGSF